MAGKTLAAAAAAAGMSERAARRWQSGPLPSTAKASRWWRTREDPFADVWQSEVVPQLVADPAGKHSHFGPVSVRVRPRRLYASARVPAHLGGRGRDAGSRAARLGDRSAPRRRPPHCRQGVAVVPERVMRLVAWAASATVCWVLEPGGRRFAGTRLCSSDTSLLGSDATVVSEQFWYARLRLGTEQSSCPPLHWRIQLQVGVRLDPTRFPRLAGTGSLTAGARVWSIPDHLWSQPSPATTARWRARGRAGRFVRPVPAGETPGSPVAPRRSRVPGSRGPA